MRWEREKGKKAEEEVKSFIVFNGTKNCKQLFYVILLYFFLVCLFLSHSFVHTCFFSCAIFLFSQTTSLSSFGAEYDDEILCNLDSPDENLFHFMSFKSYLTF